MSLESYRKRQHVEEFHKFSLKENKDSLAAKLIKEENSERNSRHNYIP